MRPLKWDSGCLLPATAFMGKNAGNSSRRLLLHALMIEFTFPLDGNHYRFHSPPRFEIYGNLSLAGILDSFPKKSQRYRQERLALSKK